MPPIDKTRAELVELAERLRAIAKVLQHPPADHAACVRTLDYLCKEIRAIAAQLKENPSSLNEG